MADQEKEKEVRGIGCRVTEEEHYLLKKYCLENRLTTQGIIRSHIRKLIGLEDKTLFDIKEMN